MMEPLPKGGQGPDQVVIGSGSKIEVEKYKQPVKLKTYLKTWKHFYI